MRTSVKYEIQLVIEQHEQNFLYITDIYKIAFFQDLVQDQEESCEAELSNSQTISRPPRRPFPMARWSCDSVSGSKSIGENSVTNDCVGDQSITNESIAGDESIGCNAINDDCCRSTRYHESIAGDVHWRECHNR
ncbi:hypothetical protein CEXT_43211 [Caerostris extrusa]|uniref:Uncharacterized protein n=1 Tax=Caerostris extrusa TaxID=172846 RepID=A0AAV4N504_CAEEX|nr:hypothetical protein CEXT_43211 [Caerostris extrusa]